jgi:hypothetical protein
MVWACFKNGWYKGSKGVTGWQTRKREKKRTRLCGWIMLNWASGIWVYKDENKSFGQNRWVVIEAKAKLKKPVLKKN